MGQVSELTGCVSSGGGGSSHGGQAICRLTLCALLLLFLSARCTLEAQRHRRLAVGAGEAGEEDAADALSDARCSCGWEYERR